jgi:hypothetical protein
LAKRLPFQILPQPDDTTCGPTCLHAVYRYFGEDVALSAVVAGVPQLEDGGTLAVFLGTHALRRGYRAKLYTYNLQMFDPTWFGTAQQDLAAKLSAQVAAKPDPKLAVATGAYLAYLAAGGTVHFEDLTLGLIRRQLKRGTPILTGLSSTYLHRAPREFGPNCDEDDVRGAPQGHFVVLCGYDATARTVLVADPLQDNPVSDSHVYAVPIERVLGAILLGIVTYDANLLVLEPPHRAGGRTT